MMVELRKVDHGNWIQCIELQVADEQRRYVNPNIFSLAEAFVHSDANKADADKYYRCIPFAIYHEDKMVGFAMITYEKECDFDDKPAYEIYRLMIEKDHQGRGYGKEAVNLLMKYIKTFPCGNAENVYAEWHPENTAAERLFTANGFAVVGTDEDRAVMARRNLGS